MIALRCALLCLVCGVALVSAITLPEEDMEAIFTGYMTRFNKVYPREEFFTRFKLFRDNYMSILEHNNKPVNERHGVKLGTNHLSDHTAEEYRKLLGFRLKDHAAVEQRVPRDEGSLDPKLELDWVAKGAVVPVKDQGRCGSCWAFSAVSAAESAIFLAGKGLASLSEQQVVDCTLLNTKYQCEGCGGCLMHRAFQYMVDNKGLCREKEYPYMAETGQCLIPGRLNCSKSVPILSYDNVTCGSTNFCDWPPLKANETDMLEAVTDGPLAIAVEADSLVFQQYESGVLDSPLCGTELDHGVVIVGYGTENGTPYWKVRNSWGATWGDKGYIKIARGKNICGIALYSNQPYAD